MNKKMFWGGGGEGVERVDFFFFVFSFPLHFSTDVEMIEFPADLIIWILLMPREGLRS